MELSEIILCLVVGFLIISQIFWIRRGDRRDAAAKAEISGLQAVLSAGTDQNQARMHKAKRN